MKQNSSFKTEENNLIIVICLEYYWNYFFNVMEGSLMHFFLKLFLTLNLVDCASVKQNETF